MNKKITEKQYLKILAFIAKKVNEERYFHSDLKLHVYGKKMCLTHDITLPHGNARSTASAYFKWMHHLAMTKIHLSNHPTYKWFHMSPYELLMLADLN